MSSSIRWSLGALRWSMRGVGFRRCWGLGMLIVSFDFRLWGWREEERRDVGYGLMTSSLFEHVGFPDALEDDVCYWA
jgi:hypothetical protein